MQVQACWYAGKACIILYYACIILYYVSASLHSTSVLHSGSTSNTCTRTAMAWAVPVSTESPANHSNSPTGFSSHMLGIIMCKGSGCPEQCMPGSNATHALEVDVTLGFPCHTRCFDVACHGMHSNGVGHDTDPMIHVELCWIWKWLVRDTLHPCSCLYYPLQANSTATAFRA